MAETSVDQALDLTILANELSQSGLLQLSPLETLSSHQDLLPQITKYLDENPFNLAATSRAIYLFTWSHGISALTVYHKALRNFIPVLNRLKNQNNLTALNVSRAARIEDEFIAKLKELKLEKLQLCSGRFEAWEKLEGLVHLKSLFLIANKIRNEALAGSMFQRLTSLSFLYCESLTSHAMNHISKFTNLVRLSLANCRFILDGKNPNPFQYLTNLQSLDVFGTLFSKEHLQNISHLTSLVNLQMTCCSRLEDNHQMNPFQNLNLYSLQASSCPELSDQTLMQMSHLTNLTKLSFGFGAVSSIGFQYFTNFQKLIQFSISKPDLSAEEARNFRFMTQMTDLNFSSCSQLEDLSWLARFTQLEVLTLNRCSMIGDLAVANISSFETLTELDLSNCPLITDQTLQHVAKCKKLTNISFDDCELITDNGISFIALVTTLTELSMDRCNLTDDCLTEVVKMTQLKTICVDCDTMKGTQYFLLTSLVCLKELTLSTACLWEEELIALETICQHRAIRFYSRKSW